MDPQQPSQPSTPVQPQQPTPVSYVPSFQPPHKNPWILWILTILVIVFASTTGYLLIGSKSTQQPVATPTIAVSSSPTLPPAGGPTANWVRYVDQDYNFEVKYPQGWKIHKYEDYKQFSPLDLVFTPNEKDISLSNSSNPHIGFTITVSVKQYDNNALQKQGESNGGFSGSRSEPITFQGLPANKSYTTFTDTIPGQGVSYIIFNQAQNGWRLGWPNTDFKGNHDSIYDQILSTFKFL